MNIRLAQIEGMRAVQAYVQKLSSPEKLTPEEAYQRSRARSSVPGTPLPYNPRGEPSEPSKQGLPPMSIMAGMDVLGRAQFMEGLSGHPWGTKANKASSGGSSSLIQAIAKMMLEIDPTSSPMDTIWTERGVTGMYRIPWMAASRVLQPFGLDANDVLSVDMTNALADNIKGSFYYEAGRNYADEAQGIISGEIGVMDVAKRVAFYAKRAAISFSRKKQVQDKAQAEAVAIGMLPGAGEEGDFDLADLGFSGWSAIISAVLASPRAPISQELFDWLLERLESGVYTQEQEAMLSPYLTEIAATGDVGDRTDKDFAMSMGVDPGYFNRVKGAFIANTAKLLRDLRKTNSRAYPQFLNDLENQAALIGLAKGKVGPGRMASDKALRSKIIRLAHANPALRPHLLPLL